MRRLALLLSVLTLVLIGATPARAGVFPARIDLPDGFFPEGIATGHGTSVYVGSLIDGAIWKGDVRTGAGRRLATGIPGHATVGVDYEESRNRVWVAGGGPAIVGVPEVRVYDGSSGRLLASFPIPGGGGFVNDLVVTKDAVYATDSFVQHLIVVPLGRHGSLPAAARTVPITGDYVFAEGFNANGITAVGRDLIVVDSPTGKLYRLDPRGRSKQIDLGGATLVSGDGLEPLGHTVYVVQNEKKQVSVVRLHASVRSGTVSGVIGDDTMDAPTTTAFAAGRLWTVNARFTTPPTPTTKYWITRLPAR